MDEFKIDVVGYIIHKKTISPRQIMKKFHVGWAVAQNTLDDLEMEGILGSHEVGKPRQVLFDNMVAVREHIEKKNQPEGLKRDLESLAKQPGGSVRSAMQNLESDLQHI